jgi:eukaryotic-like serine/threonine-protein kinase
MPMDSTAPTAPCHPRYSSALPAPAAEAASTSGIARTDKRALVATKILGRPRANDLKGRVVKERYRLTVLIGHGGMSVVYLARCLATGEQVAVKILRAELVDRSPYKQRFLNEIEAVRRIRHPVIVRMYDVGELDDGRIFLVMELIRGPSLKRLLKARRLPLAELLPIASAVAEGLAAAHAHGVVHRDLKPANILVPRFPEANAAAKLVDFGIARIDGIQKITNSAEIVGTPRYISPEQALCHAIDHRADIYAFGVTLYEACTGRRLFEGGDPRNLLRQHVRLAPSPMNAVCSGLTIPRELDALVMACLEKTPQRRPQSMVEVVAALAGVAARGSAS